MMRKVTDEERDISMPNHPTQPLPPFCPGCSKLARDMRYLDEYITGDPRGDDAVPASPEEREAYIITEDGTYNPLNGHFLCDSCYVRLRMPSSPAGWVCP